MVALSAIPHKAADNFFQKMPAAECTISFSTQRGWQVSSAQCRRLPGDPTAVGIMGDVVLHVEATACIIPTT